MPDKNSAGCGSQELCIALDLGGTNIAAALVDASGRMVCCKKTRTQAHRGAQAVVADLVSLAIECSSEASRLGAIVRGVGIGSAGQIDPELGVVVSATDNLPGFSGLRLRDIVADATGLETYVDNDANAAALGEAWVGAAKGCNNLVCLTLGTGVGGGIIANGSLVHGIRGCGGELGHMSINFDGPECNCGSRGCLESYVSTWAVEKRIKALALMRGGSWKAIYNATGGAVKGLFDAARDGDREAIELADEVGRYLGFGVASLANALAPQMVVLGGGISQAGEILFSAVRKGFRERALLPLRDAVQIVPAKLGEYSVVVGAAALVWRNCCAASSD